MPLLSGFFRTYVARWQLKSDTIIQRISRKIFALKWNQKNQTFRTGSSSLRSTSKRTWSFRAECRNFPSKDGEIVKDTKKSTPLDRVWQDFLRKKKIKHAVPRISNEILDKGVRWMPRLKKAMKDAVWRRYASGRCPATYDPAISEWDNPIR